MKNEALAFFSSIQGTGEVADAIIVASDDDGYDYRTTSSSPDCADCCDCGDCSCDCGKW